MSNAAITNTRGAVNAEDAVDVITAATEVSVAVRCDITHKWAP